jgi:hypothetical protein
MKKDIEEGKRQRETDVREQGVQESRRTEK